VGKKHNNNLFKCYQAKNIVSNNKSMINNLINRINILNKISIMVNRIIILILILIKIKANKIY